MFIRNIIGGRHELMHGEWILSVVKHKRRPHAFLLIEGLDENNVAIRKRAGLVYRIRNPKESDPIQAEIEYFDVTEDMVWPLHQDEDNYICRITPLSPEEKCKLEGKIAVDQKKDGLEQKLSAGVQQDGKLDSLTWAEQTVTHVKPDFDFRNHFGKLQVAIKPPEGSFLQLWDNLFYTWYAPDKNRAATLAIIDYLTLGVPFALAFFGALLVAWALPRNLSEEQPEPFTGINICKLILISPLALGCGIAFLLRGALALVGAGLTVPFVGVVRCFEAMHRKKDSVRSLEASFFTLLNPFRRIFETNKHVHSRTLRTSFWQKLSDTFFAFSGTTIASKKAHRGIFDYVTLMVPYGISRLALWLNSFDHPVATVIAFPFMLMSLATDMLRYSSAAVFTLVSSLLVGVIQIGSKFLGDSIKSLAMSLELKKYEKYEFNGTLNDFLHNNSSSLQDLRVRIGGTYNKLTLEFRKKSPNVMAYKDPMYKPERDIAVTATVNLNKKDDRRIFNALLKLNVGNITRKLELMNAPAVFFRPPTSPGNIEIPLISSQQRMEALCQGLHPRLGKDSWARLLAGPNQPQPNDSMAAIGDRKVISEIRQFL